MKRSEKNSSTSKNSISWTNRDYWMRIVVECAEFGHRLAEETSRCTRNPDSLKLSDLGGSNDRIRLQHSLAFGQHLRSVSPERRGQFGMYGTSAGIELLGHRRECVALAELTAAGTSMDQSATTVNEWAVEFAKTLNFLHLVAYDKVGTKSGLFTIGTKTLLRKCHILRSYPAAYKLFELIGLKDVTRRQALHLTGQHIYDFMTDFDFRSSAKACFSWIKDLKVSTHEISHSFKPVADKKLGATFSFAQGTEDVPENWKDWIFVWSTVITACVRANMARLVNLECLKEMINEGDIEAMMTVLVDNRTYTDPRYKLICVWALDQLLVSSPASTSTEDVDNILGYQCSVESNGTTKKFNRGWMRETASAICCEILRNEQFSDVHSPYEFYFQHSEGERDPYQTDYYVIPVVPLLLEMTARYQPKWLFYPSVSGLINGCLDTVIGQAKTTDLPVIPKQVGNYNGTVNALYYIEAMKLVGLAIEQNLKRSFPWALAGRLREFGGARSFRC